MIRMFGGLLNPIKWIFYSSSFLFGVSLILSFVSSILSHTRDDFPLLQIIFMLSLINGLIFIHQYRIIRQLGRLQIQIHKFSKISGILFVTLLEFWMLSMLILSDYFIDDLWPGIISFSFVLVPFIFERYDRDILISEQYGLGSLLHNYVDEDKLSAPPIGCSVNIDFRSEKHHKARTLIDFRSEKRNKRRALIDWSLENGKKIRWDLNLKNSDVILYLSNLINQPQTTLVWGIPVYTQLENIHTNEEIRNIVQAA